MLAQQIKEELNSFKMVWLSRKSTELINTNNVAGDGSARALKTPHTFLLMNMHLAADITASWRITFFAPGSEQIAFMSWNCTRSTNRNKHRLLHRIPRGLVVDSAPFPVTTDYLSSVFQELRAIHRGIFPVLESI